MEYTDENIIELYNKNLSYSEIAKELTRPDKDVTRGMISAKVRRLIEKFPKRMELRKPSVHPAGKVAIKWSRKPNPKTGKLNEPEVKKEKVIHPNRYTIRSKPFGYNNPSKAALREMLRKAVENT
jgi:hypothetical protein